MTQPTDAERATALIGECYEKLGWHFAPNLPTTPEALVFIPRLATALATVRAAGWKAGVEAAAQAVPTTWLDALLIDAPEPTNRVVLTSWVEGLCRAIAGRIRALAGPGEREGA